MSITTECRVCGEVFRKRSLKSTEKVIGYTLLDIGFNSYEKDALFIFGIGMNYKINKDYSMKGRIANIDAAQKIAHYLHNQEKDVIVSLVSPYLDQREEFKKILGDQLIEFYIYTNTKRGREQYHVEGYQPPLTNFIDVDTTVDTPEESLKKILNEI